MSDNPKDDDAAAGVLAAMTLVFSGEIVAAEAEMQRVKGCVPEEACDFLFGMVVAFVEQVAEHIEVHPLQIIRQIGMNSARMTEGLEVQFPHVGTLQKQFDALLEDMEKDEGT